MRFVLSPEYQTDQRKAIFGYEYRYDSRGNIVKKMLPQCQYTQYWYDHGDKVTFMQDANLRTKNKYRFVLYDRMVRPCVQGLCDDIDRSANVSNGNIEHLQRRGRKQDGHVGKIDNLHIYHKGNQLDMVQDDGDKIYYAGIFNFNGDDNNVAHYKYNESGSLTEDTGRGITNIEYDDWNNPKRIQFANGNATKYVYSADGQKLRTVHYTAAPNISVAAGQTHELSKDEILSIDSTDYIGRLVLKNGKPDMYLFAGGYYKYLT